DRQRGTRMRGRVVLYPGSRRKDFLGFIGESLLDSHVHRERVAPPGGQGTSQNGGPTCYYDASHWRYHKHDGTLASSVLDQSLESLLHRLRGLCDNMEPETFVDHEMVFLLKGQQASPFVLRTRRSMDKPGAPWHLRYLGQPEMGDKNRHALVRNCVDIATSDNLTDFLVEMGFRMDHEFVAKGHVFRKGIMKIVVYKIFRILLPGNTDNIEPLSLSYLVELSVVAPAGQDMVHGNFCVT
ncbi:hypothetical protein E2320_000453, partial [Naja naja]